MSDKIEPDSSMVVSLEEIVCEKQKEGKKLQPTAARNNSIIKTNCFVFMTLMQLYPYE